MSNNHLSMSNNQMFYVYRLRRMLNNKQDAGLPSIQTDGLMADIDPDDERETLRQKLYKCRGVFGGAAVLLAIVYVCWFFGMMA